MRKTTHAHVVDHGGDGEVIILLHGFISSSSYWSKIWPLLVGDGYHVISIDLLGFGKSPKPKGGNYSYSEHIDHIFNAIQTLRLSERFVLVGHSMGALLAARFANMHGDLVRKAILLHPPIYTSRQQAQMTLQNTGRFYRILLKSHFRDVLWVILRNARIVGKHNRHSRENSLKNIIEQAELLTDLQAIRTDTLLLVGNKDRAIYLENLHGRSLCPNITLLVEIAGHHSPRRQPNLVHDRIRFFAGK